MEKALIVYSGLESPAKLNALLEAGWKVKTMSASVSKDAWLVVIEKPDG